MSQKKRKKLNLAFKISHFNAVFITARAPRRIDAEAGLLNNELIGTPESRETDSRCQGHQLLMASVVTRETSENEALDLLSHKMVSEPMLSFFAPDTSFTKIN